MATGIRRESSDGVADRRFRRRRCDVDADEPTPTTSRERRGRLSPPAEGDVWRWLP